MDYVEPVPGGQHRTKTIRSWQYENQQRSVSFGDVVIRQLDGQQLDLADARKRLGTERRVILGFFPSEQVRELLKEDTIVILPKEGVQIKGFSSVPH